MPAFESMDLIHRAVYWEPSGVDDDGNKTIVSSTGVEIPCRWDDTPSEVRDRKGNVLSYDGSAIVDQDLIVGGILWRGRLNDLPDPLVDLRQVWQFLTADDLKGRNIRRKVLFMRFTDTLPTVES
jgi:hypothetical protein